MMRKHKWIRWMLCAVLICALSMLCGCQLAQEEAETVEADRFAGISVQLLTDAAFNSPYVDRSLPHEADGRPLYLEIGQTETGEEYMAICADDCFTELRQHFTTVDTEEEKSETVELEATMYICSEEFESTPYLTMEHVYRRADGTVYAVDCGSSYGGHLDGLSVTLEESGTFSDGMGGRRQYTVRVKLSVKERAKVERVRLFDMRGTEAVGEIMLGSDAEVWLLPDTEWVLMEESLSDGSVRRTALNRPLDNTVIELFTVCEQGVFVPQRITLRKAGEH